MRPYWRRRQVVWGLFVCRPLLFAWDSWLVSQFFLRLLFPMVLLAVCRRRFWEKCLFQHLCHILPRLIFSKWLVFWPILSLNELSSLRIVDLGARTSIDPCRSFLEVLLAGNVFIRFSWSHSSFRFFPDLGRLNLPIATRLMCPSKCRSIALPIALVLLSSISVLLQLRSSNFFSRIKVVHWTVTWSII